MKRVFRVSPCKRFIIADQAIEQMMSFAQRRWFQPEAGGVLLGRHLLDSEDVVADEVTTPQSTDLRGRFSFFRSSKHEALARERWQAQLSTLAYLGLWHTHPEKDPTPSSVDHRDWQNAVANDTFEGEHLFFPIIGTHRIRVWCLTRNEPIRELIEEIRHV